MTVLGQILTVFLLCVGTLLLLIAAIGVVRMPDVFLRISAVSKASTLGVGCVLGATALAAGDVGVAARAVVAMAFVFLTTPVASHMLGRAAYLSRAPLWRGTVVDELRGRYDLRTRTLRGAPAGDQETKGEAPRP
jgi:multicomponent Na+:H+ antiporter subunit G